MDNKIQRPGNFIDAGFRLTDGLILSGLKEQSEKRVKTRPGRGFGFDDEELDILHEYGDLLYEEKIRKIVSELIGRSPATIYSKARDLELIVRSRRRSTQYEDEQHYSRRKPNLEILRTNTCPCGKQLYDRTWGDPWHFELWCICGHSFFFNRDDRTKLARKQRTQKLKAVAPSQGGRAKTRGCSGIFNLSQVGQRVPARNPRVPIQIGGNNA